jgi:hypothetical protein
MDTGFLMSIDIFHGYGFGTAKPSGFIPVAIFKQDTGKGIHETRCLLDCTLILGEAVAIGIGRHPFQVLALTCDLLVQAAHSFANCDRLLCLGDR